MSTPLIDDEPEIPLDDDVEIPLEEPAAAAETPTPALVPPAGDFALTPPAYGLVEVLPADFPLPALVRFVPDVRLKAALDQAVAYALAVKVEGAEGLERADLAVEAVRTSVKAILEDFREPTATANELHTRLTGMRGDWCAPGRSALKVVGERIALEKRRLDQIAAEQRRKDQEEADRRERERLRREAEEAARAQAPAPVVEELKKAAATATAPPVQTPATAAPAMSRNTVVGTWKARPKGTPADAEPNPEMAELSDAQRFQILGLMKDIVEGKAPMVLFEINWGEINRRAKAEKKSLALTGIEAYEDFGIRAKGTRRAK